MQSSILNSLKPTSDNSAAIEAALNKIIAETNTTTARAKDVSDRLEAGALIFNSKERRALKDDLEDANLDFEQLAALETSTRAALEAALHGEAREVATSSRAALVARLIEHEAGFLGQYRVHEAAIVALLAEATAIDTAINEHNDKARNFSGLSIRGIDDLNNVLGMTKFYKTQSELSAIRAAEQSRRDNDRYERQAMLEERHRMQRDYAANRSEQLPPIVQTHSPSGKMVTRI